MILLLLPFVSATTAIVVAKRFSRSRWKWAIGCLFFAPILNSLLQLKDGSIASAPKLAAGLCIRIITFLCVVFGMVFFSETICHSVAMRTLQYWILNIFLPIREASADFVITLTDNRSFHLTSAGEQAFAALTFGFLFGCSYLRHWLSAALILGIVGFFAGLASRTVIILVAIYFGWAPPSMLIFELIVFLLFCLSLAGSFYLGFPRPLMHQPSKQDSVTTPPKLKRDVY